MGTFKKGLFLGGLAGAALMWLNVTPKGKEMRAKMMEHLDPLYNQLKASLKQLQGPTKEMYEALVERAVEEYAAKKEMAVEVKSLLIKELKKRWSSVDAEMKNTNHVTRNT
jgi:gas vesicle protein